MSQPPDGLPSLGEVVRDLNLAARKGLGQHFILDLNVTRRIARAAGPLAGKTVVEIGPGPGGLTRALFLEGAERVIAVERDERCRPALEAIASRYPGRLEVHFGDAVEADWRRLISGTIAKPSIIANLPYNVATLLVTGWLECTTVAAVVRAHGADVPEGGSRAIGGISRHQGLRTAGGPGSVAHAAALALCSEARGLCARPGRCFCRRGVPAHRAPAAWLLSSNIGETHCCCIRSAPKDAAPEPQAARCRA